MGRSMWWALVAVVLAGAVALGSRLARSSTPTPNILILLADDIGVDKVGAYAAHPRPAKTPTLDALAARGMRFDRAYAAPACSPTRAALLTGRYGRRTGVGGVIAISRDRYALPEAEITLAEMLDLSRADWSTAALGKWHLSTHRSDDSLEHPRQQGFDHYAGYQANFPKHGDYSGFKKVVDGREVWVAGYATSDTIDDTLAFVEGAPGPWLAYVAFHAAHFPFHVPPDDLHSDRGLTDTSPIPRRFDAAVEALDTEIGRLLEGLGPEVRRNTLIIFLGDNGTPSDAVTPPWPSGRAKLTVYEGGVRVPLIISGPGVVAGSHTDALVHAVDVFPTVAALARVPLARLRSSGERVAIDGRSLLPVLADPTASVREVVYNESFSPNGHGAHKHDERSVFDGRFKLIARGGARELYDLKGRDFEGPDLLREHDERTAAVALRLESALEEQLARFGTR